LLRPQFFFVLFPLYEVLHLSSQPYGRFTPTTISWIIASSFRPPLRNRVSFLGTPCPPPFFRPDAQFLAFSVLFLKETRLFFSSFECMTMTSVARRYRFFFLVSLSRAFHLFLVILPRLANNTPVSPHPDPLLILRLSPSFPPA